VVQQTWIITFNNASLAEANQQASQLKKALQDVPRDIIVSQQSSIPHTQNLGDMIIATIKDTSTIAAVIYAIAIFIRSSRSSIRIRIKEGKKEIEIEAKNIDSKNYKETLEHVRKQAEKYGSVE
jgi:hypothetical protein